MGAPIASLVEGDGVVARGGEEGEKFAPGVGEFGEAVDADDEFGGGGGVGGEGFDDVEYQAVGCAIDVAGGEAGGEVEWWEGLWVDGGGGRVLVGVRHDRFAGCVTRVLVSGHTRCKRRQR